MKIKVRKKGKWESYACENLSGILLATHNAKFTRVLSDLRSGTRHALYCLVYKALTPLNHDLIVEYEYNAPSGFLR